MDAKRQNNQMHLAYPVSEGREASTAAGAGTEPSPAARPPESPARHEQLMEAICERENLQQGALINHEEHEDTKDTKKGHEP